MKILLKKRGRELTGIASAQKSFTNMTVDAIGYCWTIRGEAKTTCLGGKHTVSVVGTLVQFLTVKSFAGIVI